MNYNYVWMFFVILKCVPVSPRSTHGLHDASKELTQQHEYSDQNVPKYDEISNPSNDQVISVKITSSVAVGRRKEKPHANNRHFGADETVTPTAFTEQRSTDATLFDESYNKEATNLPPNLIGANMEFIKQLNAKKDKQNVFMPNQEGVFQVGEKRETFGYIPQMKPVYEIDSSRELSIESSDIESLPTYHNINEDELIDKNNNYTDSIAEPSLKSVLRYELEEREEVDTIPQARSMPPAIHNNQYPKKEILLQDAEIESNKRNETNRFREPSAKSVLDETDEDAGQIPLGRSISISPSPDNYISALTNKPISDRGNSDRLTTVSFSVVHDTPKQASNYNKAPITNVNPSADISPKFYEPPKIYSQPAQVYSEPAKFYSEPAKIYGEPAKVYSEPAKVYSEPAKIYSEPAKFYSPPASLHLPPVPPDYRPWQHLPQSPQISSTSNTTPISTGTSTDVSSNKRIHEPQPEKNYEVDEKISVLSEGRIHGVQESTTEKCKQDNCKVGYVVEGRQYKKYRVEERTSDGFIVGEYGVVRNEDGALRGVRYTADSDASPRLIYDALMKFLQLK